MPMTDKSKHDDMIEAAFAEAQLKAPEPSADLMARVLADAETVQAGFERRPPRPETLGGLRAFFEAFGGWPAMAGLTAAGVAGVWLGVSPATGVSEALASYLGGSTAYAVDIMPGAELGLAWDEGGL